MSAVLLAGLAASAAPKPPEQQAAPAPAPEFNPKGLLTPGAGVPVKPSPRPLSPTRTPRTPSTPTPTGVSGSPSVPVKPASALRGQDVSWPQCPVGLGRGLGLAHPSTTTDLDFSVIGISQALPYSPSLCVRNQVRTARAAGMWVGLYTVAVPPTPAELALANTGPFGTGHISELKNNGYKQGRFDGAFVKSLKLDVPLVWIDVEPLSKRTWPTGPDSVAGNRAFLTGLQAGLRSRGFASGFYSYKAGWELITGGWKNDSPVWLTLGKSGTWAKARAACRAPSWSGGPVKMVQWYTPEYDFDVVCASPTSLFTRPGVL